MSSHPSPRSVVALAFADEILGDSTMLADYSREIQSTDPVTLVVYSPDADPDDLERSLAPIVVACGLDADDTPDVVGLAVPGDDETRATIRSQVDCLLTKLPAPAGFEGVTVVHPGAVVSLRGLTARVAFTCNVCGQDVRCEADAIGREIPSCATCGSTVRFRAVANAVSVGLFGKGVALDAFPLLEDVVGIGLSDWDGYAIPLADRLGYRNTYLHTEPRLDILDPDPALEGTLDFLVSSEVFEHVPPPLERAFASAARLLKPNGFLVLTVPFHAEGDTQEHFPELHDWTIAERQGRRVLFNATADGRLQEFGDLVFHGGDGLTLEMRVCALGPLLRQLRDAGFDEIHVLRDDVPEFGIWQEPWGSWPILARKAVRPTVDAATSRAMKSDWDERARENALHFVASSKREWEETEFYELGQHDVAVLVEDDLAVITGGRPAGDLVALEVGCGAGRMTGRLAAIFGTVHGVDVSGEMVRIARRRFAELRNVTLTETSGTDVSHLPSDSVDFAFSYIVFQHVPVREAIVATIRDVHRVLRPGSIFKFQVQGSQDSAYLALEKNTWMGVTFAQPELDAIAGELGFEVLAAAGEGTQYFWQWWRKPATAVQAGASVG